MFIQVEECGDAGLEVGNSLAIGLPAVLVEVLGLKAGDQVAITVADADFKFDRLEERGDRR